MSGVLGIGLYLAVGFVYLVSGLVVPPPWLVVLWMIWLVGLYPLVMVFRRRRVWTPLVPVAAAVFWALYLTIGEMLLGWTA
ncbi:MAG: hypothetical protein ACRDVL_03015 [Acidimicrobiia bacterium]